MPPQPHFAVAAFVRDLLLEWNGRELRGTRLFAPGTLVHVAPPMSGDGWARTYLTGPARDTGRYVRVVGPRARLQRHHRRWIDDPEMLAALGPDTGPWQRPELAPYLATFSDDPLAEEGRFGWAPGEWDALTAGLLSPRRPELARCVATALGVSEDDARALIDRGAAGRALHRGAIEGRPTTALRAAEAWEALAPITWTSDPARRFHLAHVSGAKPKRAPNTLAAVACYCADVAGVTAAESLAREVAAACGVASVGEVVWRVAQRSELRARATGTRSGVLDEASLDARLAGIVGAVIAGDDPWRERVAPTLPEAALAPLFGLVRLGYAIERLSPESVTLMCPTLPR